MSPQTSTDIDLLRTLEAYRAVAEMWWGHKTPARITTRVIPGENMFDRSNWPTPHDCAQDEVIIGLMEYSPKYYQLVVAVHGTVRSYMVNKSLPPDEEILLGLGAIPWGTHICRHCGEFATRLSPVDECLGCYRARKTGEVVFDPRVFHPNYQRFKIEHADLPIAYWHNPEWAEEYRRETPCEDLEAQARNTMELFGGGEQDARRSA